MILLLITQCCLLALILLVWFKSEAFTEYSKLFRVQNFFFVPLYEKEKGKDPSIGYLDYLTIHHDSFFVRLITCPLCIGFWLSLAITYGMSGDLLHTPITYVGGLAVYGLTSKILE